ncbi:MAG: hypothetical protein HUJ80_05115 [Firmicutes bacterium]|nr:hypothetical protein [Bacillota bacterium]
MTRKERFVKFLKNEPVDRVPVAFFHHFCEPNEWMKGLVDEAIFQKNIEGHRTARAKFEPDVVKVMNDSLMIMPAGCENVKCAADLRNITPPKKGSAWFEKTRELTCKVLEIYQDSDAPKFVTGFSPMMILRIGISGFDLGQAVTRSNLELFLEEDPDAVLCALDNIGESVMQLNEMLIKECGADGIYMSVNNQANYLPDEMYRKYIAPGEKKMLAHMNTLSDMNLLHICGYHGKSNNLELYADYEMPGINWAVYADRMTLADGKKFFGGKPVFGGFSQDGVIYTGTKDEVQREVWKILDEAGQVGIMIGDDCTVPNDIDDSRFNWVVEACEKYAEGKVKLIHV